MQRSTGARLLGTALVLLAGAAGARDASAQIMGIFNWQAPAKVQEAMEKDQTVGVFYFTVPGEIAAASVDWNFSQPTVIDTIKAKRFACCKLTCVDSHSSRPWGSYQKLADEWGVGLTTTLIFAAFDRTQLGGISGTVKRDEFIVYLNTIAGANTARIKASNEAATDIAQAEKWIESKNYDKATTRIGMVLKKESKITKKVVDHAKEVDAKLEEIGKQRFEEGKALLDGGKAAEALPVLEEVVKSFGRYEFAKEARALAKKAKADAKGEKAAGGEKPAGG